MSGELEALGATISSQLSGAISDVVVAFDELTLNVRRDLSLIHI